jgi:hypothetical protein
MRRMKIEMIERASSPRPSPPEEEREKRRAAFSSEIWRSRNDRRIN